MRALPLCSSHTITLKSYRRITRDKVLRHEHLLNTANTYFLRVSMPLRYQEFYEQPHTWTCEGNHPRRSPS
jgi:hypothetical protein